MRRPLAGNARLLILQAETLFKPIDTPAGIHKLLLAREERMAF